jgi:hypothetical protein
MSGQRTHSAARRDAPPPDLPSEEEEIDKLEPTDDEMPADHELDPWLLAIKQQGGPDSRSTPFECPSIDPVSRAQIHSTFIHPHEVIGGICACAAAELVPSLFAMLGCCFREL